MVGSCWVLGVVWECKDLIPSFLVLGLYHRFGVWGSVSESRFNFLRMNIVSFELVLICIIEIKNYRVLSAICFVVGILMINIVPCWIFCDAEIL